MNETTIITTIMTTMPVPGSAATTRREAIERGYEF